MNGNDEWSRDPSVQMMRRIFSVMERLQEDLLQTLHISPYDSRLRHWREKALPLFEKAWAEANQRGTAMDENRAGAMYVHGLSEIMRAEGVNVPESPGQSLEDLT